MQESFGALLVLLALGAWALGVFCRKHPNVASGAAKGIMGQIFKK
jgi:hypothetical protein